MESLLRARFCDERDEAAFHNLVRRHGSLVMDVCLNVLAAKKTPEDAFQGDISHFGGKAGAIRKKALSRVAVWGRLRTALKRGEGCLRATARGCPCG